MALPVTITKTQVASTDSPANAPTVFNTNTYQALEDLFGIPDALAVGRALLRSVLAGCQLSNDGSTPNTVIDVAAGIAMSSDQLLLMDIGAFTGTTGGIWATGTGAKKMDTATAVAASTWYHVFVIGGGGNATDILFSLSATAPTLPAGYTKQRRIGSFLTDGSANILTFTQDGDYFRWKASVLDKDSTNPGTGAVSQVLASVPTGVNVFAIVNLVLSAATSGNATILQLSDLSANDELPSLTAAPGAMLNATGASLKAAGGPYLIRTDTSARVRTRMTPSGANDEFLIVTLGWIDRRGRDL